MMNPKLMHHSLVSHIVYIQQLTILFAFPRLILVILYIQHESTVFSFVPGIIFFILQKLCVRIIDF